MVAVSKQIKIMHGLNDGVFPVAGESVGCVRQSLRDAFNIRREAITFVNGGRAQSDYRLAPSDVLEFIFPRGRKGAGPTPGTATRIPVQSICGAEPLMCSENVEKRIRAMGGRAVFGWAIKRQPFMIVKFNHCVWEVLKTVFPVDESDQ